MTMIIRNNIRYACGGSGGETVVELTQEEYNALGDVVNSDNKTYYITDADDQYDASSVVFDNTENGMSANNVQGAIDELNKKIDNISLFPDYSKAVLIETLPYTIPSDGTLYLTVGGDGNNGNRKFYINDTHVADALINGNTSMISFIVSKDDVFSSDYGIYGSYKFVPFKKSIN